MFEKITAFIIPAKSWIKSGTYGFGISADQEVYKNVGVFGRVSFKDPSVATVQKIN
jgi:hypothetical protein